MEKIFGNLEGRIRCYSGLEINLINPTEDMIDIRDIARGLAYKGHFGGQTPEFFSIAQHCILVCNLMEDDFKDNNDMMLLGLLHDASEAYLGDMVKPLKVHLPRFQEIEHNLMQVICNKFNLRCSDIEQLKKYDIEAQKIEFRTFYMEEGGITHFMETNKAYEVFLEKYKLLNGA